MLAWWVGRPGPIATRPLVNGVREDPKPGAHELLVKVSVCGTAGPTSTSQRVT